MLGDGDPQYAQCTLRVNDSSIIDRARVRNLPEDSGFVLTGEGTLTLTELEDVPLAVEFRGGGPGVTVNQQRR